MRQEKRNNGLRDYMVVVADDGKWLRRKSTGEVFGSEIALGYSHYIGGEYLDSPHEDIMEDFEEFDAPIDEINAQEGEA